MPTITKHNIIIIGTAIVISAGIFIISKERQKRNTQSPLQVSYNIFNSPNGWGYDILENNKIFIHQDFVPALPVQKGFSKKEYAEKAAQLVIQKMHNTDFPTLTKQDLAQICPLDKILYEPPANQ